MSGKRTVKSKTRASTRERSKSVGRATPKSRSRTPTRSRSPSRISSRTKLSRTPASESKLRRRRDSISPSPERPKVYHGLSKERRIPPDSIGDKAARITPFNKEPIPSRFSQRIITKLENNRVPTPLIRSISPSIRQPISRCGRFCETTCTIFREKICPSPIMAALCLLTLLPCVFWLNLLVLSPATPSKQGDQGAKTQWGPAYRFAGVNWPVDFYVYFNVRCVGFVLAYLLLHVLLHLVPIGYRVASQGESRRFDHRCNGILAFIVSCGLFAMAQFCKWGILPSLRPSLLLPKYHFALLFAAAKIGSFLAVIAYIVGRRIPRSQVNPEGNTGNFFVDFWVGRSIRPRWFGIDWKMLVLQPGCTAMLLVELTYLCTQWERYNRVSPALAAMVVMHSIWMLDFFIFEHTMMSSFEVRREGFGYYQIIGAIVVPFLYSLTAVYLSSKPDVGRLYAFNGDLEIKHCVLLGISIMLFLIGFWINRASNNQKDLFCRQPNHPSFAEFDRISGIHSQRMLAGGWWGLVRHPNYLGEILAAYAIALPAGCYSSIPWIYPLFLSCFMLHRICRTENLSADKYGLSVNIYKKLVPSALVPRIY